MIRFINTLEKPFHHTNTLKHHSVLLFFLLHMVAIGLNQQHQGHPQQRAMTWPLFMPRTPPQTLSSLTLYQHPADHLLGILKQSFGLYLHTRYKRF
jgi:hypothetical protein